MMQTSLERIIVFEESGMIVFEESDDANIIRKDKVLEESGNDVNII
jgi:hypothetical protein